MLDESHRLRLAEMGIDVYALRAIDAKAAPQAMAANGDNAPIADVAAPPRRGEIVLLADATSTRLRALIAAIVRALAFAQIACVHADVEDEAIVARACALVMFGDAQSRVAAARVAAHRQREMGWVVAAELSQLARDGAAKRALWCDLKRTLRSFAARNASARH